MLLYYVILTKLLNLSRFVILTFTKTEISRSILNALNEAAAEVELAGKGQALRMKGCANNAQLEHCMWSLSTAVS